LIVKYHQQAVLMWLLGEGKNKLTRFRSSYRFLIKAISRNNVDFFEIIFYFGFNV